MTTTKIFTVLCVLIFQNTLFAQLQEQDVFGVKGLPFKEIKVGVRKCYGYSIENGQKVLRFIESYNKNGLITHSIEYYNSPFEREFLYNNKNKIINVSNKTFSDNDTTNPLKTNVTICYNTLDKVNRIFDDSLFGSTYNEFDLLGRLSHTYTTDSTKKNIEEVLYSYDTSSYNKNIKISIQRKYYSKDIRIESEYIVINPLGNIVEKNRNGSKELFVYNDENKIIVNVIFRGFEEQSTLNKFTYKGDLIIKSETYNDGVLENIKEYYYKKNLLYEIYEMNLPDLSMRKLVQTNEYEFY